jgi:hypothetical protein
MHTRSLTVAATILALASLAACSGSHHPSATSTPPTSTVPASSAPATPPSKAVLTSFMLIAADLPSGWTGTPPQPDPNDDKYHAAFATCTGIPDSNAKRVAEVDSDDFSMDNATVSSSATSFSSQGAVDSDRAALLGAKATDCFKTLVAAELKDSLPSGASEGTLQIAITPTAAGGPAGVLAMLSAQVDVTETGQTVTAYSNVAFIAGPLVEAEVDAENVGAPVDTDVLDAAITAVAQRVAEG